MAGLPPFNDSYWVIGTISTQNGPYRHLVRRRRPHRVKSGSFWCGIGVGWAMHQSTTRSLMM
jgi:hypothetical protein